MNIRDIARHSRPIIAAHRGSCGGNIPPNTLFAYEAALFQGAAILETDVARSRDGIFYMFHSGSGNELQYLNTDRPFEELYSEEIDSFYVLNEFQRPTTCRVSRFETFLKAFKGRGIINLDRAWDYWEYLIPTIDTFGMRDQILLKSPCESEWLNKAKRVASDYAYMPIVVEDIGSFYAAGGDSLPGFCGAELVFSSEDSPIIAENVPELLHRSGKAAWGNGIRFSQVKNLNAGHGDDISITGHPEEGWGWLIRKGFDIIQTDWVQALNNYIISLYPEKQ